MYQVALLGKLVFLSHQPGIMILFLHLDALVGHGYGSTKMLKMFDLLLADAALLIKRSHLSFDLILSLSDLLLHSFHALLALEHVLVVSGQALELFDVGLDLSLLT